MPVNLSVPWFSLTGQDFKKCAFPASTRTDDTQHLTTLEPEREAIDGFAAFPKTVVEILDFKMANEVPFFIKNVIREAAAKGLTIAQTSISSESSPRGTTPSRRPRYRWTAATGGSPTAL